MAALSADKKRFVKGTGLRDVGTAADSITVYAGALIMHNNAGRVTNAADTASFKVAGVATSAATFGASNTTKLEFEFGHLEWFAQDGNLVSASIGLDAVCLDNATMTNAATATNDIRVGKVIALETRDGVSGVWVHVGMHGTAAA